MVTQHYLSFLVTVLGGIIDLQCSNCYHLPSVYSSKFQSPTTIFHHKLLTREGGVLANGWTHPLPMTIFVHLFIISVIRKVTIVTSNTIFSVVFLYSQSHTIRSAYKISLGHLVVNVLCYLHNAYSTCDCYTWPSIHCCKKIMSMPMHPFRFKMCSKLGLGMCHPGSLQLCMWNNVMGHTCTVQLACHRWRLTVLDFWNSDWYVTCVYLCKTCPWVAKVSIQTDHTLPPWKDNLPSSYPLVLPLIRVVSIWPLAFTPFTQQFLINLDNTFLSQSRMYNYVSQMSVTDVLAKAQRNLNGENSTLRVFDGDHCITYPFNGLLVVITFTG
jgi:hypothetical protein